MLFKRSGQSTLAYETRLVPPKPTSPRSDILTVFIGLRVAPRLPRQYPDKTDRIGRFTHGGILIPLHVIGAQGP